MRFYAKYFIGSFGALMLAIPALAAGSTMHMDSMHLDVSQQMTIGNTQLDPGRYTIKGREAGTQLEVLRNDKVVATVPCQWVRLSQKAEQSEVLSNSNQVTGIHFQGRSEAVKIGS